MLKVDSIIQAPEHIVDPKAEEHLRQETEIARLAEGVLARVRIPRATYRLQITPNFTFAQVRELIDYFDMLGISDLYSSPILQARAGSTHGYDICDHSRINPELGGEPGLTTLSQVLHEHGLGLLLDIVPNHMGVGAGCSDWWTDVLENGPSSNYACYFDISWEPVKPELQNKVLLPILDEQYGDVLEGGKLKLDYDDGAFSIRYSDYVLPVAPRTYCLILDPAVEPLSQALPADDEHLLEFRSILTALSHLPPRTEQDPDKLAERNRERQVIKRRLATLYDASENVRDAINHALQTLNGIVGEPHSFDRLDELLEAQPYRTAYWRVAAEEINYRRFFDINNMAAIRVELPEVFEATHALILRLASEGHITGVRVDHPDGLWNPTDYFRQLQSEYLLRCIQSPGADQDLRPLVQDWLEQVSDHAAGWRGNGKMPDSERWFPLYAVAEKILSEYETLPRAWANYGTTGYDFLNSLNGIFVNTQNEKAFNKIYQRFIDSRIGYAQVVYIAKQSIMQLALASEINSLSHQLERIAEKNRHYRDFTLAGLTRAIREVIAALNVYRTYVDVARGIVSDSDVEYISAAVAKAKRRAPRLPAALFDFLSDTLLLRNLNEFNPADRAAVGEFVMRFQQMTGPMMAKGVEDTAFYQYNRLVSLNEVGGNPAQFGQSVASFHRQNAERFHDWRYSMLATSTHDTKRSEDVRARLNVLSEIPDEWRSATSRWRRLNASKKIVVDGESAPDHNDEYLLYQTILGAWCLNPSADELADLSERLVAYMEKATKEAKVHTSWINPNPAYDQAVKHFVRRLLPVRTHDAFLASLVPMAERVAFYGRFNSLSQTVLKLTVPGVPDIYQGTELFDFSLVDPDNRRPVDFSLRRRLLSELREQINHAGTRRGAFVRSLLQDGRDSRSKLLLTFETLRFRSANAALFADGSYRPLEIRGENQDHVCAFARDLGMQAALIVAPRLFVGLTRGVQEPPLGDQLWQDTWLALPLDLAEWHYRNIITGETLLPQRREDGTVGMVLRDILRDFPVALLART